MPEDINIGHPATIAQVMVNFAARHGIRAAICLAGTGMSPAQLQSAGVLIERAQEMRLVENLIAALPNVAASGFELGLQYDIAVFGIWGFALRASRNVRDAVQLAIRYLPLSTAYCRFAIFQNEDEYGVAADASSIPPHLREFLLERDTATAVNLFHQLGLSGTRVKRIEYRNQESPGHAARIHALCGIAPVYGAQRNAVVLHRTDAERALPTYNAHWVGMLEEQCRAELESRRADSVTRRVQQLIPGPTGAMPSLPDVARQLALAPRTLRRKLRRENTSFRRLLDARRKALAAQLLKDTSMKLAEVASHLGYDDAASFRRAFRRWFAQAPHDYRKSPDERSRSRARNAPGGSRTDRKSV